MQFTKHFTGVTAVLYLHESIHTVAMLLRPLHKRVDKGSYDDKFKGYSSKCVYLSLMFIVHVVGFHYFVM